MWPDQITATIPLTKAVTSKYFNAIRDTTSLPSCR
jgi:hypothetical protein